MGLEGGLKALVGCSLGWSHLGEADGWLGESLRVCSEGLVCLNDAGLNDLD